MSGIGPTGYLLLAIVALLLFGPNKLPELGRAVGRTLREFKAGTRELVSDDQEKTKATDVQAVTTSSESGSESSRTLDK